MSAKERLNHAQYKKNKNKFDCAKCHDTLSTKQMLQKHENNCSASLIALKWIRKEAEREGRELIESEDEGGDSNSDQEELKSATKCQVEECGKLLNVGRPGEKLDWWCSDCGYGLCADCRAGSSYAHVLACAFAYKRVHENVDRNAHRERKEKKK